MAKKIVMNTVDETIARMGNADTTAEDMIKYIRKMYEKRHQHSIFDAREQFIRFKYAEGTDMAFHVSQVQVLADELTKAGRKIDDVEKAYQLLSSLPDSWKQVRDRCLDADTIDWEDVQAKVMSAYRSTSMTMRRQSRLLEPRDTCDRQEAKSDDALPSMACSFCEQPNHAEEHCLLREKLEAKLRKQQHSALAVYTANPVETKHVEWFLSVSAPSGANDPGQSLSSTDWIVDSGATRHVCMSKTAYYRLRPCDEVVMTASGERLSVLGVGDLAVTTSGSPSQCALVLRDCLYVPSAKMNCLSVRQLVDSGATIDFRPDGTTLRARDGAELSTRDAMGLFALQLTPAHDCVSLRVDQNHNVLTMIGLPQPEVTKAAAPSSIKPRVVVRGIQNPHALADAPRRVVSGQRSFALAHMPASSSLPRCSTARRHALRDAAIQRTRENCRPLDEIKWFRPQDEIKLFRPQDEIKRCRPLDEK